MTRILVICVLRGIPRIIIVTNQGSSLMQHLTRMGKLSAVNQLFIELYGL
jgi:hypothetical protein